MALTLRRREEAARLSFSSRLRHARPRRAASGRKPWDLSPRLAQALQFTNIFVCESNQTVVHLAKGVHEYRNIDLLVLVLVFQWLESTVKKGVLYAVYQIWNNTLEPKGKPFFASVRELVIEPKNLSNPVDSTFSQIFVNKTVSDAVDWLGVDANDPLTHIPIAHFSPHHRPVYTLDAGSPASTFKYCPRIRM
ncbi:MAG TPA: hypothetical protein VMB83_01745 [Roseiarcus sp.]|nr:hypothetical protein [Roseiarcus sp.]